MHRSLSRAIRLVVAAAILVVPLVPTAFAGTTGTLTGVVTNEKREPLAGVNVRVVGQRLGAMTDEQGRYTIVGIPGGSSHSIQYNMLGYAPMTVANVAIVADFTTTQNVQMKVEAVELEEVRVESTRPLLQRDATSTARFLPAEDLQKMPVRGYKDAAAQQSGIVNFQRNIDVESNNSPTLIIRGGRPNETAYYVDGFSQQDPLTGNSTTTINNNAIEEVVVLSGGFNAEYGRIMSGVVNVITKEGGDRYSGSLEAVTDNISRGSEFLNTRIYDYNVYDGSFGGPISPGKEWGNFYLSGQRRWQEDRAPKGNYGRPVPANSLGGWTGQGKLSFPLAQAMTLKFGALASLDDWQEYRNSFRFNLAHAPRYEDRNQSYTGQLNHTLSSKGFYNVAVTFFQTERKRGDGLFFDDIPAYASVPDVDLRTDIPWFLPGFSGTPGDPLSDSLAAQAARVPGSTGALWDDYLHRSSSYVALKGDYTTQWNPYHQIKAGFQVDQHQLRFYQNYFPKSFSPGQQDIDGYGYAEDGRTKVDDGLDGAREPRTASVYLQDKYERSGLVVNAGLRWDYLDVNAKALVNEDVPLGSDGVLTDADLTDGKTYHRVSPRLGVGFPISDKSVLHVNWGQFFQQPNLQDLYVSYRFLEYKIQTGGYFVPFGNPNLKPEHTTAYEVGLAHQMNEYAKFDVTAYYKDIRDLVQIATVRSVPNSFSTFRNRDFGTVRGVDVGFTLRRVNNISANVSYSLSFAKGTGSVSQTQRNIAWTASEPPRQTSPLDFDQRHKLAVNLDYSLERGEGPKVGRYTPFSNFGINLLYNVASGTPFTPTNVYDEQTLAAVASQPEGPLNSRYGPWTQSLDLKATKSFPLAGLNLDAYVWLLNAFDTRNAITVYTGTGSPYTSGYLQTPEGQALAADLESKGIDPVAAYNLALQGTNLFSTPRTIRFGVRMGF